MAARTDVFDLASLGLSPGEARKLDLDVEVEPLTLGEERYSAAEPRVPVRLEVARLAGGHSLRLRFDAALEGPCMRCLEAGAAAVAVNAQEVHQAAGEDLEQRSPYVVGDALDLSAWSRDALALELPDQIVCRAECLGLCATCGENLNAHPEHEHEADADPRWAKLAELHFEQAPERGGGRR